MVTSFWRNRVSLKIVKLRGPSTGFSRKSTGLRATLQVLAYWKKFVFVLSLGFLFFVLSIRGLCSAFWLDCMGCTEFSLFYPPLTPLSVLFLGLILTTLVESPRTTVSGCSFSSSFLISLMLLGLAFSGQKADLLGCCILTNSYSMVLLCKSVCVSY